MTTQPEYILEENLIKQLQGLGYKKVVIKEEEDLINNLKTQLEKHNNCKLSKDNIFEKIKTTQP